jgi:hypothetical protein
MPAAPSVQNCTDQGASRKYDSAVQNVVRSGAVMDMNQRQIALSLLETLREDLIYAHLNNGSRILDVADLRQYIYEQMGRIRTTALVNGWTVRERQWPQGRNSARVIVNKSGESESKKTEAGRCAQCPEF